ncbi:unnamed protein product [Calicophoron daubneyi]|uniref:long-chain-fatty-acid--CoA ligase n=1 Tax=Calicophoron daubneyi TaxID=300641 RepID=A0AAV2TVJ5_CALDB
MAALIPFAAGSVAISLGAFYWFKKSKQHTYPFDIYTNKQSFVVDPSTGIRVSPPGVATDAYLDVNTVYDVFERGLKLAANLPCLGQRSTASEPYEWKTYEQVKKMIDTLSVKLVSLLETEVRMIGIQARNCLQWLLVELACVASGLTIVPFYETYGEQALRHILDETRIEVMFCESPKQAKHLLQMYPSKLRHIIVFKQGDELEPLINGDSPTVHLHSLQTLLSSEASSCMGTKVPSPDDVFMICYTSGSTGLPKGVLIKHKEFIHTMKAFCHRLEDPIFTKNPVHLSYLPLAHILEQHASLITLNHGGRIGFLTSDFSGLLGDLKDVQPIYFFAVPRVLSRIYSTVLQRLSSIPFGEKMLQYAVALKNKDQQQGYYDNSGFLDFIFFRKIRSATGGRIKAILSGGAPLPDDVLRFTRAAFGCPVVIAYGLTETDGCISLSYLGDGSTGHVGALLPGVMAKLVDVPALNLSVSVDGIGEIRVKGPNCSDGYFNDVLHTKELFDSEGWMCTGDLGTWTEAGALKIVGRCKLAFKLAQGEYVSPDKVEAVYQLSRLVNQAYVDGNSLYAFAIAIIVPNMNELRRYLSKCAEENGGGDESVSLLSDWETMSDDELCSSVPVREAVLRSLNHLGRVHDLKGFELAKSIYLTNSPFTTENELLTGSMKLCRFNLRRHFESVINELYDNPPIL